MKFISEYDCRTGADDPSNDGTGLMGRVVFGLAVLATGVVFVLQTVRAKLESTDSDAGDIGREPGERRRLGNRPRQPVQRKGGA